MEESQAPGHWHDKQKIHAGPKENRGQKDGALTCALRAMDTICKALHVRVTEVNVVTHSIDDRSPSFTTAGISKCLRKISPQSTRGPSGHLSLLLAVTQWMDVGEGKQYIVKHRKIAQTCLETMCTKSL